MNDEVNSNQKTEMSLLKANVGTFIRVVLIGILFSILSFIAFVIIMSLLGIVEDKYVYDVLMHSKSYCVFLGFAIIIQVLVLFGVMYFAVKDQFRKKYLSEENFKRYKTSTLTLIIVEVVLELLSHYNTLKPYLDVFKEHQSSEVSTTIFSILFVAYFIVIPIASYFIYKYVIKLAAEKNSIR